MVKRTRINTANTAPLVAPHGCDVVFMPMGNRLSWLDQAISGAASSQRGGELGSRSKSGAAPATVVE